jgi:hypothetical protein
MTFYVKHFQRFHKGDWLFKEITGFQWKLRTLFPPQCFRTVRIGKTDKAFLQVALAYSVHVGEKIAQCWSGTVAKKESA